MKTELNQIILSFIDGEISYYDALLKITSKANETNIIFIDEAIKTLQSEYAHHINLLKK